MLRRTGAVSALLSACLATTAFAGSRHDGAWAFKDAPAYPGVTMMQLETKDGAVTGSVTTRWYGPIAMQNAKLRGNTLTFDARTLNDKKNQTRRWTATFAKGGVSLAGDIWNSHVEQKGARASEAQVADLTFRPTALPPLGAPLPDDGLARTPPMGWSSWNKFAEHIDDKTIRAMADALVETGLRDAGYVYVNIDDGWQGERDANGVLQPNAKFPDMKALADYVHSKGLKLGIYSSPGPKTCAGFAGSYGHVQQDAKTFAAWGVDYLKYDLCSGEWFYADADTVKRTYHEMGEALRATGRPIVYSLCQYGRFDVSSWGRTVGGHLWRTTGDITDDYKTMAEIGFDKNPKFKSGPGGWSDPDMLEIGNGGMSDDEYRTHMTLWAMQAAPLVMGHDLRQTSVVAKRMLEHHDVIAIDQDALGKPGVAIRKEAGIETWRRELVGGRIALAVFNRTEQAADVVLQPADAGAAPGAVRDVWSGNTSAALPDSVAVPRHGVVLMLIEAAR